MSEQMSQAGRLPEDVARENKPFICDRRRSLTMPGMVADCGGVSFVDALTPSKPIAIFSEQKPSRTNTHDLMKNPDDDYMIMILSAIFVIFFAPFLCCYRYLLCSGQTYRWFSFVHAK